MKIAIQKGSENIPVRIECTRLDGSIMESELPPHAAYHDLAHFVVETHFSIDEGFWGMIAKGFHLKDYALENEDRPFSFSAETYRAEFLATLLQSAAYSGEIPNGYDKMLRESAEQHGLPFPEIPDMETWNVLVAELRNHYQAWNSTPENGEYSLEFRP